MNSNISDSRKYAIFACASAALALGMVSQVNAGCGDITSPGTQRGAPDFAPSANRPAGFTNTAFMLTSDGQESVSIVGLWKFEWLSDGKSKVGPPVDVLLDFGMQAWHADGTEIMNSGNQNPADSNFCLGTWRQTGRYTYKLTHIPLAYGGGSYVGPVEISEVITLSPSGNSFTGRVWLTPYLATKIPGHEFDENNPLVPEPITGIVKATRVSVGN